MSCWYPIAESVLSSRRIFGSYMVYIIYVKQRDTIAVELLSTLIF